MNKLALVLVGNVAFVMLAVPGAAFPISPFLPHVASSMHRLGVFDLDHLPTCLMDSAIHQ